MKRMERNHLTVVLVRLAVVAGLVLAWTYRPSGAVLPEQEIFFIAVAALAVAVTLGLGLGLWLLPHRQKAFYYTALPLDLIGIGMVIMATRSAEPVYVALLVMTAAYALLLSEVVARSVSVAAAFVWMLASLPGIDEPYLLVTRFLQALGILAISALVTLVLRREREQRAKAEGSAEELATTVEELRRRVNELNAISEIAGAIHSSLDIEHIGRLALDAVRGLLHLDWCALELTAHDTGEVLFQGSMGREYGESISLPLLSDEKTTAILRAESAEVDRFTQHEWMVLATIVSELAVAVDKAQLYRLTIELAHTDELTGLYNYRHLAEVLNDEVERARRYRRPLSLLMIDFDRFKLVNDTYGHVVGDRVLAETAAVLRDNLRSTDVLARYGGEEFSAVLPETDQQGARSVAEKLRCAVEEHAFVVDDQPIGPLSVSIGYASLPQQADSARQLLTRADDALYTAKASGRNSVCAPPEGATPRERA